MNHPPSDTTAAHQAAIPAIPAQQTRPPATARPWQARFLTLFRVSALLFALGVLVQAVLAGEFVTGNVELLKIHNVNAQVLSIVVLAETVAAFGLWRTRLTSVRPALATLALLILTGAQMSLGHDRVLLVHIPLGVTVFGFATALAVWSLMFPARTRGAGR
ncbi:MAG: hypothetical protein HOY69_13010 [Streptomyces sp.]|nr:hypothetical protein [Streptomyces sp.]